MFGFWNMTQNNQAAYQCQTEFYGIVSDTEGTELLIKKITIKDG